MPLDKHLSEKHEHDPYLVTSPLEIVALLRSIEKKRPLIRMYAQGGTAAIITTLLEVDTLDQALIFDNAAENSLNQRIVGAGRVLFETSLDKISVRFASGQVTACLQSDRPALRIAIPAELTRMQRRDFYRISTPVVNPVVCVVPVASDGKNSIVATLPLEDISGGGISIFDDHQVLDHTMGTVYQDCTIDLPEIGLITVTLKVMHLGEETLVNGKTKYRLGCAFVHPTGAAIRHVQRYIGKLERERNARQRGYAS